MDDRVVADCFSLPKMRSSGSSVRVVTLGGGAIWYADVVESNAAPGVSEALDDALGEPPGDPGGDPPRRSDIDASLDIEVSSAATARSPRRARRAGAGRGLEPTEHLLRVKLVRIPPLRHDRRREHGGPGRAGVRRRPHRNLQRPHHAHLRRERRHRHVQRRANRLDHGTALLPKILVHAGFHQRNLRRAPFRARALRRRPSLLRVPPLIAEEGARPGEHHLVVARRHRRAKRRDVDLPAGRRDRRVFIRVEAFDRPFLVAPQRLEPPSESSPSESESKPRALVRELRPEPLDGDFLLIVNPSSSDSLT